MSHIKPCVGGSRKRSIWIQKLVQGLDGQIETYVTNIVEGIEFRGEASMNAEKLLIHDCR
jgi:hypothetical protein